MESEISLLSDRLETRKVVERAKGLLQRQLGIDEETAYLTLQKQCRQRRLSMKKVAEAIVLADDIKRTQNHPTRH
jgi:uroporphyrinogen-III synthase